MFNSFYTTKETHRGIILNSNFTKKNFLTYIYIYIQRKSTRTMQVVVNEQQQQMAETKIIDFSTRPGSDINEKLVLHATFCVNNWSVERDWIL